jgi:hypothetical protein
MLLAGSHALRAACGRHQPGTTRRQQAQWLDRTGRSYRRFSCLQRPGALFLPANEPPTRSAPVASAKFASLLLRPPPLQTPGSPLVGRPPIWRRLSDSEYRALSELKMPDCCRVLQIVVDVLRLLVGQVTLMHVETPFGMKKPSWSPCLLPLLHGGNVRRPPTAHFGLPMCWSDMVETAQAQRVRVCEAHRSASRTNASLRWGDY